jgi:hypothetical protein
VHDLLRLSTIGDGLTLGAVRIDPGPWLSICNFADTCKAAMDRATGSNSVLHATAGGTVNIGIENAVISGFRYGVRIDAGAVVGESKIDSVFEVGTVIDASAGGNYAPENVMTGQATCAIPKYATAQGKGSPCFNMGANSSLFLHDFLASASGDFVSMAGGYLRLQNAQVESARDPASTADYYIARLSGSMSINIQNSRFAGTPSNAHAHGIVMSSTPLDIQIQNNLFLYLNEVINMATGGANIITGNMSSNTTGASAITLTGGNQVIHANNRWDKSPLATISACGTGPQSQGAFAGLFVAGPGAPTDCTITFPWVPYGFGAGACAFTLTTPAVTVAGAPISNTAWTVHFSAGYNGAVYYNCPGQN